MIILSYLLIKACLLVTDLEALKILKTKQKPKISVDSY